MEIFLITFIVMTLAVTGMALGVLVGRRGIKGSCGGLNTLKGLESACSACSGSCEGKEEAGRRKP